MLNLWQYYRTTTVSAYRNLNALSIKNECCGPFLSLYVAKNPVFWQIGQWAKMRRRFKHVPQPARPSALLFPPRFWSPLSYREISWWDEIRTRQLFLLLWLLLLFLISFITRAQNWLIFTDFLQYDELQSIQKSHLYSNNFSDNSLHLNSKSCWRTRTSLP